MIDVNATRMTEGNTMNVLKPALHNMIPFDANRLDELLEASGIDVLIASSKHNVQYLLGGYRFFFFDYMDAIGISRYLPLFVYQKGKSDAAAYFGNTLEIYEKQLDKLWTPRAETRAWGTIDAIRQAIGHINSLDQRPVRIGVERSFLPADAEAALREAYGEEAIIDAHAPLERLRARKTPGELQLLREASDRVVAAMTEVFGNARPGMTKDQLVQMLRVAEVERQMTFEYCLIAAGRSHNRSPSDQTVALGDVISLDSGGNYKGYIGDLCRMGVFGSADNELKDLLAEVDVVQQAARRVIKAGARGGDVIASGDEAVAESRHRQQMHYTAHGMGLVSHEAPRLTSTGPVSYPGSDEELPLEAGMVISIETSLAHPTRGFIKLEDTVAVTENGYEAYGDSARGWNVISG